MKIFLDTASLKEIREAAALGVIDGITTNPTLLSKEGGEPEEILVQICETVNGPISAEVVATDAGCLMNIAGCLRRRGSKIRAIHLAEILART